VGKIIRLDDYRNYAHRTEITEKQEDNSLKWLDEMPEEQYQAMLRAYEEQCVVL
jgi:hypothetical protein